MRHSFRGELPDFLPVDRNAERIAFDLNAQFVPGSRFELVRKTLFLGRKPLRQFFADLSGLSKLSCLQFHVARFQVGEFDRLRADLCHEQVTGVDLFELQVGEVQPQAVSVVFEHEPERDDAVSKLRWVRYRNGVIGRFMQVDVHRTVAKIDLLVSVGALSAVRTPSFSDFFFGLLRLVPLEIVFKQDLALLISENHRRNQKERKNQGEGSEASDHHGSSW